MERHPNEYVFVEPNSIRDAKQRKLVLERDIRKIEFQLTDRYRVDREGRRLTPAEYLKWRVAARSSLLYKVAEHAYIKEWLVTRRRAVQASEVGIFDHTDPRGLLQVAEVEIDAVLGGAGVETTRLRALNEAIRQFLLHEA